MKRILLYFLLSCMTIGASAQDDMNIVIGQKADGSDITVTVSHFKRNIKNYSYSPDFKHLGLEFVNNSIFSDDSSNGLLGVFDVSSKQLSWKKTVDYNQSREVMTDSGVILTEGSHKSYYDYDSGVKKWAQVCSLGTAIHNSTDHSDILLGYQSLGNGTFAGLDINKGDTLWTTKIYHNNSYAGCKGIQGNKYLVVGDKLCLIDLFRGPLKTYDISAGVVNSREGVEYDDAGSLIAGMVGNEIYSIPIVTNSNVITGLNSNICVKDSSIYFADRERLICFDFNLSPRWTYTLPHSITAHSVLSIDGDNIYMLNMGNGLRSNKTVTGIPYLASFNRHTGILNSIKMLADHKEMIQDAVVCGDRFFILTGKGIASRTASDTTSVRYAWNSKKYGIPYSLLNDTLYAYNPSTGNFAIMCHDDYNCPVLSTDSYLYMVDKDLYVNSKYPISSLYKTVTQTDQYAVITNGNMDSWIIRRSGVPVMHFSKAILNCDAKDNKIVILTTDNDICITDIDRMINK